MQRQQATRETRETGKRTKTEIARERRSPFIGHFLDRDVTVTSTGVTVKSRHPSVRDLHGHHLITTTRIFYFEIIIKPT